jgi:hypothetical protein
MDIRNLPLTIVGFSPRVSCVEDSVRAMKAIDSSSDQPGVGIFGSGR